MADFTLTAQVRAPVETVFDVLTDHAAYASMTPLCTSVLEHEGVPAPNGVGAVRTLGLIGPPIRERVIAYERPTRFAYEMIGGMPVEEYTGTVDLECLTDGSTRVSYRVHVVPKFVPGVLHGVVAHGVKPVMGRLLAAVKTRSERLAAGS